MTVSTFLRTLRIDESMNTLTATRARASLYRLVDEVAEASEPYRAGFKTSLSKTSLTPGW